MLAKEKKKEKKDYYYCVRHPWVDRLGLEKEPGRPVSQNELQLTLEVH